jgi:hypothetical protein
MRWFGALGIEETTADAAPFSISEREELIGALLTLARQRPVDYCDRIATKIENRGPKHGVAEEALPQVLGSDKAEG